MLFFYAAYLGIMFGNHYTRTDDKLNQLTFYPTHDFNHFSD